MDTTEKILLTSEGLAELKKERGELEQVKRPALVERIAAARGQGDLSENSEYTAAREELAFVDGRIAELKQILHEAKVVSRHSKSHVAVGSKVTVNMKGKKEMYTIVGEWEADPMQKKVSRASPLGKALMGKKIGEEIEVDAPAGRIKYKILSIA